MGDTLKILVDRYKKGLLNTPNIQVTDMVGRSAKFST